MRTYYYLKNANGEVDFVNSNGACFAEIFESTQTREYNWKNKSHISAENRLEFVRELMKDRELHAYISPDLPLETIQKYISFVNSIFPVKFEAIKVQEEIGYWDLNEYTQALAKEILSYSKGVKYKFVIRYNDYTSDNRFKFAVYLCRYLIESRRIVEKFCEEEPPAGLDQFQWLRILSTINSTGHNYLSLQYTRRDYSPNKSLHIEPNFSAAEFFNQHFDEVHFDTLAIGFRQPAIERSDLFNAGRSEEVFIKHTLTQKQHAK